MPPVPVAKPVEVEVEVGDVVAPGVPVAELKPLPGFGGGGGGVLPPAIASKSVSLSSTGLFLIESA